MNLNIPDDIIQEIKLQFGIMGEPVIKCDASKHYLCCLDGGWKPDN